MTDPQAGPATVKTLSEEEIYRPLLRSAAFVILTFIIGVLGYVVIFWNDTDHLLVDAIYMTTITLTTVGYGETIDLAGRPYARIFTTFLLLGGVGAFVNFFSNLTALLVEGDVQLLFWRKRMSKAIAALEGHTIVCGAGHTGEHIVRELVATERPFVLVEVSLDRVRELMASVEHEFPTVIGDATDDETLTEAGIERASGLITCFSVDKDNLLVTVSARILNPKIRIIARCSDDKLQRKIRKAGADKVVEGSRIGGLRMVSEMIRPTAVSFLDLMLREQDKTLRVESFELVKGSKLLGKKVGMIREQRIPDLLLMALRRPDGSWQYNPPDEVTLEEGSAVVYMGDPKARLELEKLA